ncbi:MAG: rhodanese-like domain-containing protein [Actinomycetota bacterium]|nr:rhodanese-like domain-containing protein [Actinomycetota bacterium]
MAKLLEFDDIAPRIGSEGLHLFDVRWYLDGSDGYSAYLERHIRSSMFLDVDNCLSNHESSDKGEGRHPLPNPKSFELVLESLGVARGDQLVFYDDQAGSIAARAWWMASAIGFDAALLNGGLDCVPEGMTDQGRMRPRPMTRLPYAASGSWNPELVINEAELKKKIASDSIIVLDARSKERYLGINESIDPRAGHIPGAVSAFWRQNIDSRNRFKKPDEIARNFRQLGIEEANGKEVASSCGSGITACHNIFSLLYSMNIQARLYPPSFSGWCSSPENRVDQ